ncbi:MAG: septum formation initiator family protein [Ruminococcus sp.]|nr:septum formation initiator family protein [Ruminococcus sp.]
MARKKKIRNQKAAPKKEAAKKTPKKAKNKKSKLLFRILQRGAIAAAIIGCTVLIISVQSDIAEKQGELQDIKEQINAYEAENEDLARILNSGDTDRYMEKLAREDYGYAYPDEFRFYDTSRN